MSFMVVFKNHRHYSFKNFVSILKIYLGLQGGTVALELDIYEYCHKLNIVDGQFKETVRTTLAPFQAIDLFHRYFEQPFVYTRKCSPTIVLFCPRYSYP